LHNEKVGNLYASPYITMEDRKRNVSHAWGRWSAFRSLVRTPERKTPLRISRLRWKYDIKMNIK